MGTEHSEVSLLVSTFQIAGFKEAKLKAQL